MPDISNRAQILPASPIRKLVPYADAAKRKGRKVYHLNIGQPDVATPPNALQAVRDTDFDVLAYAPSAGTNEYRAKLAKYYAQKVGTQLSPEDFITTTGASEALNFAMIACMNPGDELVVPEPFYANYNGFSIAGGVKVKPITASIDNGFALPPIQDFEQKISPKTKGILICNPSNPTGYLYSKEELMQLRDIVLRHNLFLFVDEVYRDFVYDNKQFHSVLNIEGIEENAVVFDSISKRYSSCGGRIGALVSRNKDVTNSVMKLAQARLSPPTFGLIVAEAVLDAPINYVSDAILEYDRRRQLLIQRLNAMGGVVAPTPGGAFYAFAQLPIDDSEKFCQWLLEDFEYNNSTVMMAPGSGFYATKGLGKQEVRIAYVLNEQDLNAAMDCLQKALEQYARLSA